MLLLQEGQGHTGSKASRVIFCGSTGKLFSTGFSRTSDRQYGVWNSVSGSQYVVVSVLVYHTSLTLLSCELQGHVYFVVV